MIFTFVSTMGVRTRRACPRGRAHPSGSDSPSVTLTNAGAKSRSPTDPQFTAEPISAVRSGEYLICFEDSCTPLRGTPRRRARLGTARRGVLFARLTRRFRTNFRKLGMGSRASVMISCCGASPDTLFHRPVPSLDDFIERLTPGADN